MPQVSGAAQVIEIRQLSQVLTVCSLQTQLSTLLHRTTENSQSKSVLGHIHAMDQLPKHKKSTRELPAITGTGRWKRRVESQFLAH